VLAQIYRLYERRLLSQVGHHPMPRHIGLILDGNRRYGRQHNLTDPREIYAAGAEKLAALLSWCAHLTIPAITLWVLSTDNFDAGQRRSPHSGCRRGEADDARP
jgi:short-chain Z-isoprenyl diphosphate synthase